MSEQQTVWVCVAEELELDKRVGLENDIGQLWLELWRYNELVDQWWYTDSALESAFAANIDSQHSGSITAWRPMSHGPEHYGRQVIGEL
jgi:hypothetical protein